MKFVEVLPLTKTGAEDQVFTYETEEELPLGSLVSVPLRNRLVRGMVTGMVKKPAFKTRPIAKVLSPEPVLNTVQLEIAKRTSEYYLAPLGDVISTILPFDFGKKRRTPLTEPSNIKLEAKLALTPDQKKVFEKVKNGKAGSKYLLFGVTGSGKTEIYLQLIEDALKAGKGAIVLVPEISLTPQTVERFKKRFGETVAVWHSGMKETEKFREHEAIKAGEKRIVVGARSAIFAPVSDLGYVIIDEEHEGSYKQDQTPRYEATKVAEWTAELTGAKLVLGSATPKIESYKKAEDGEYVLCSMNKRIVQEEMPPVTVVDLADEFKKGNKSIFSDALLEAIKKALSEKKQAMLFVNRRGAATFIICRDCGYVSECPHCEVPLTYHPSEGEILKCHHCNHRAKVPVICPDCNSAAIKYFGLGTQRAELEAKKLFPAARVCRMDRDTTKKRGSHEEIYTGFANKDFDILIGTQLIAKGWDLPNVSVVGVISADTTLNIPDFRSAERTFSLLTQVAGRTGRGYHPGRVVIQTYAPDNYAVKAAKNHNYEEFYTREIKEREKYQYPPVSSLIKLTYSASADEAAKKEAGDLYAILSDKIKADLLGPSPAFINKLAGKYRWQIIIKVPSEQELIKTVLAIKKELRPKWTVDVSPETLL